MFRSKLPFTVAEIDRESGEGGSTSGEGKTDSSEENKTNLGAGGSYHVHGVPLSALNKYN